MNDFLDEKSIYFFVPGQPVAKARARTVRTKAGSTVSYTPEKTANFENLVKFCAYKNRPAEVLFCPVSVVLRFYFQRPKSKKNATWHVSKPDLDNLEKAVLDACNGIIWRDDSQVVKKQSSKAYAGNSEQTGIEVLICWEGSKQDG